MTNTRYIDIDTDTRVGYNFIKGKFYVTNKGYTTYRPEIQGATGILSVLHALDIHTITEEDLTPLKSSIETLHTLYYTWQDNGAYIHTIQFNDFKDYALTIDCEKAKLYIMNSTTIYDLTVDESPKIVRVPQLCSFYRNTLGLEISQADMLYFYELLLSYYKPTCYNQIITTEKPHLYGNIFLLSNYDKSSKAVYNCTFNATGKYEENSDTIGYIDTINNETNTISLVYPYTKENLVVGDKIQIQGTNITISDTNYTDDGTYTIQDIPNSNTIIVVGSIPVSYTYPHATCFVKVATYTITSINRDTNTITLSSTPNNIYVGDKIQIQGTTATTEYETVTCNGSYTVQNISNNTIQVVEDFPTSFPYTTGQTATLTKEIFVGNIANVNNNIITLTSITDIDNLANSTIIVYNNSISTEVTVTSQTIVDNKTQLTVTGTIEDMTPDFPKLQYPLPTPEVKINVTSVEETLEEIFPIGEFMVDNFDQCIQYLSTLAGLVTPTEEQKENLLTHKVAETIDIPSTSTGITSMTCKGIFSEVYPEDKGG